MPTELQFWMVVIALACLLWLLKTDNAASTQQAKHQAAWTRGDSQPLEPCPKCGQSFDVKRGDSDRLIRQAEPIRVVKPPSLDLDTSHLYSNPLQDSTLKRSHGINQPSQANRCANCEGKLWETCPACDGLGQVPIQLSPNEARFCSSCGRPLPRTRMKMVCVKCEGTGRISTHHRCPKLRQ